MIETKSAFMLLKKEVELTESVQTIQVFPEGKVYIGQYDSVMDCDEKFFNQMITNFNDPALSKPYIDVDHEFKVSYGDIDEFFIKDNKFYMKARLNTKGIAAIKNREYKYISPAFGDVIDTAGVEHKNVLIAVTLTNNPALMGLMPSLQEQVKLSGVTNLKIGTYKLEKETPKVKQGGKMLRLTRLLNLQELANEDAIMAAVMAVQKSLEETLGAIKVITEQKDAAVAEAEGLSKQIEESELAIKTKEKDNFFELAIKNGQLEIKEADDWKGMYDKDSAFVVKMIGGRTKKTEGQKSLTSDKAGTKELSKQDREIMESEGMDPDKPEDVKKYTKYVLGGVA